MGVYTEVSTPRERFDPCEETEVVSDEGSPAKGIIIGLAIMVPFYALLFALYQLVRHLLGG